MTEQVPSTEMAVAGGRKLQQLCGVLKQCPANIGAFVDGES